MVKTVDCVFRIVSDSEYCKGILNLESGKIIGLEKYMTDKCAEVLSQFEFHEGNYSDADERVSNRELFDVLNRFSDAIIVANYNNIGALVICANGAYLTLRVQGWHISNRVFAAGDVFSVKPIEVATLSAVVYSLETTQKLLKVYAFADLDGSTKCYTRFGMQRVGNELLECKPTMEGYTLMYTSKLKENYTWYGVGKKDEVVVYLVLDDSKNICIYNADNINEILT